MEIYLNNSPVKFWKKAQIVNQLVNGTIHISYPDIAYQQSFNNIGDFRIRLDKILTYNYQLFLDDKILIGITYDSETET